MLTLISKLSLLAAVVLLLTQIRHGSSIEAITSDEYKLYGKLFENYSRQIRPVKNWSEPLNVKISVSLIKVADVIEDYQSMVLHVKLQMIWNDIYLKWDPKEYNNLDSIVVPASKIWTPDLHLFNSATSDDRLEPLHCELFSNGTVNTFPLTHLNGHCEFEFSKFPFDTQSCTFLIGTMTDKSKVNLDIAAFVEARKLFPNPEWKYLNFEAVDETIKFPDLQEWSAVKFLMRIQRIPTFYVNLFIWPLIFILFLTMCLFVLPPTCVERVTLGVLMLLSLVVMLLMLESYSPKNSFNGVSLIGRLIMFDMVMITFSILTSAFIISTNRDNFIVRAIPKWLKSAATRWLGKLTCKSETAYATFLSPQNHRDEEIEVLDTNQVSQQLQQANTSDEQQTTTENPNDLSRIQMLLVLINNQLAMFRMRMQERDLKEVNRKEWYLIACIFDRLSLIILTIVISIGLTAIFSP